MVPVLVTGYNNWAVLRLLWTNGNGRWRRSSICPIKASK